MQEKMQLVHMNLRCTTKEGLLQSVPSEQHLSALIQSLAIDVRWSKIGEINYLKLALQQPAVLSYDFGCSFQSHAALKECQQNDHMQLFVCCLSQHASGNLPCCCKLC